MHCQRNFDYLLMRIAESQEKERKKSCGYCVDLISVALGNTLYVCCEKHYYYAPYKCRTTIIFVESL